MVGKAPEAEGRQVTVVGEQLRAEVAEARQEANALTRRLAELQGTADAERQRSGEVITGLRRECDEARATSSRLQERLEEAERLSAQRGAAAAAERREAATLRGLLDAAQLRHEEQTRQTQKACRGPASPRSVLRGRRATQILPASFTVATFNVRHIPALVCGALSHRKSRSCRRSESPRRSARGSCPC